jgi:hypothetical protein
MKRERKKCNNDIVKHSKSFVRLVNDTPPSYISEYNMLPFIPLFFLSLSFSRRLIHNHSKTFVNFFVIYSHTTIMARCNGTIAVNDSAFRYAQFFIFNFMHNHWPFIISQVFCIVVCIFSELVINGKLWIRKWSLMLRRSRSLDHLEHNRNSFINSLLINSLSLSLLSVCHTMGDSFLLQKRGTIRGSWS